MRLAVIYRPRDPGNPLTPSSEVEIRPVVEPGTAMAILNEAFAALAPPAS